jgi:hypothetical protein
MRRALLAGSQTLGQTFCHLARAAHIGLDLLDGFQRTATCWPDSLIRSSALRRAAQ